jgi:hypothetical protein
MDTYFNIIASLLRSIGMISIRNLTYLLETIMDYI